MYFKNFSEFVFYKTLFRKGVVKKTIEFDTRERAENFHKKYEVFAQLGEIICDKCYTKVRRMKSIKDKKLSGNSNTSTHIPVQLPQLQVKTNTETDKLSQVLSQSSLKDDNESATNSQTNSETASSSTETLTESQHSVYCPPDQNKPHKVETIVMRFNRVVSTKSRCFICSSTNKEDLVDVPLEARLQVFIKRRLYIPR